MNAQKTIMAIKAATAYLHFCHLPDLNTLFTLKVFAY
jgi:hypothetical protein